MASVFLVCPECNKKGFIDLPVDEKNKNERGILAIDLEANLLCPHSIIVYLDNNLKVRECVIPDFKVELPELALKGKSEIKYLPDKDVFDVDLIKLNFTFMDLVYILKSILFKEKIALIFDKDFLYKHVYNFFKDITRDSFEIDLNIIHKEEYKNNKSEFKNCVVLEDNNVLRDDNKILDPKKLKVEKQIIKNFLATSDVEYSYIMLKNEINKAYELCKTIADTAIQFSKAKELNQQIITEILTEKYRVNVPKAYLTFLCEIAKTYFEVEDERIFYPSNAFKSFWSS